MQPLDDAVRAERAPALKGLVVLRAALYGPPNWLVTRFTSEDRRMFGFWTVLVAAALTPVFGRNVLYVTVLSVIALIPNFSTETPVEEEAA